MADDPVIELGIPDSPDDLRLRQSLPLLLKSRWAAWLFVAISFSAAAFSLLLFVYQFQASDLYGDPYRETRGSWVQLFAHLVRGLVSGWLCATTLFYLRELASLQTKAEDELGPLFSAISRGIRAIGVSCLMIFGLAALIVYDMFYGLPSIPVQHRLSSIVFKEPDVAAVRVAFHEAQYEVVEDSIKNSEGWIESSIAKQRIVHEPVYLNKQPILVTEDIADAELTFDRQGERALMLRFTEAGSQKLAAATQNLINKRMAIVVDDEVLSVPTIRESLSNSVIMTGEVAVERLQRIVDSINGSRKKE